MAAPSRLTALRRAGPGRIALEVDGRRWRIVPDDVVVRAGLSAGRELDRPTLRRLRRELRSVEALTRAGRVLARRDLSESALRERLRRGGVAPAPLKEATETLRRAGALNDHRFAKSRAGRLADHGWGNAAIEARLEAEGAPPEAAARAIGTLPDESERAARLVEDMPPRRAAAFLRRRGFDPDTVESVLPWVDETV